jgi:Holliday junction resolvase-like predicted endonuclease
LLRFEIAPKPKERRESALIGKAGEALVAAEVLRRGLHVAYPAYDGRVDLLAYREHNLKRVVPIQVKKRSSTCYNFQKHLVSH